ncbi:hypothetical protein LCGC14_2618310, partial [marine sediment metagenome]
VKLFSIIFPYVKIHESRRNNRNDASVEALISQIISKEAKNYGYSFSSNTFNNAIQNYSHFTMEIIEKLEFLNKYSLIFSEEIRKKILELIETYNSLLNTRTVFKKKNIVDFQLLEFKLIKKIQKYYFIETKKYISMGEIGNFITKNRHAFTQHFNQHEYNFLPYTLNRIKFWIKDNLNKFEDFKTLISDCRRNKKWAHSPEFTPLKPYQMKILIEITLGLDILYCNFFLDTDLNKPTKKGGITRAHIDEDPLYNFIFECFRDGNTYSYRIKLAPLPFLTTHADTHNKKLPIDLMNSLLETRMRSLYEFYRMSYNDKFSDDYYIELFTKLFNNKTDYIHYYHKNVKIWKVSINDTSITYINKTLIIEFVKRWIILKRDEEIIFFTEYFDMFYTLKYLPFMNKIEIYKQTRLNGERDYFNEWFLENYLPNEIFP